jgi:hypothetical protein
MVTWKGDTRGEAEGRYERGRALNQMNSHGQERQRPVVDQLYAFLENRALIASVIRDAAYRVLWSCRRRSPCRVPCPGARVACLSVPALRLCNQRRSPSSTLELPTKKSLSCPVSRRPCCVSLCSRPSFFLFLFFPFFLLFPGKAWPFRLSQVGVQSGAEASRPVVPRNAQTSGA